MSFSTWHSVAAFALVGLLQAGCADHGSTSSGTSKIPVPKGVTLVRSDLAQDTSPAASTVQVQALGASNRAFAFHLYKELAKKPGNLFFSPFSISEALAMAYAGARTTTAAEMRSALHFDLEQPTLHAAFNATGIALLARKNELAAMSTGDGFELNIVNQAWGDKQEKFLDTYLDLLAQNYGAGLFLADFAGNPEGVRTIINDWVAEQTKTRIKDLLAQGSIDSSVVLVLTNAIYFKASWLSKFDTQNTAEATFHADAGDRTVPMMHKTLMADYRETADYQAVELPYLSDSVHMLLILPAAGRLEAVAQSLVDAPDEITTGYVEHNVTLTLPKFSFDATPQLKPALQALGMQEAFTSQADFSGLNSQRNLFVKDVVHKAFVAVDETGTEAAAATAVIIGKVSLPPSAQITLDRPFIFLVYDQPTGEILFLGRLADPATP